MSSLDFRIEWEPAGELAHPALARTWARIEIRVGEHCVTTVYDKKTGGTRTGVYGPAFVLAEWITRNFWFFLRECAPASRTHSWLHRHSLAAAREGTSLPDLRLFRDEDVLVAEWIAGPSDPLPVRFVESGRAYLEPRQVQEAVCQVVDLVLEQLRGCPHPDVKALRADWDAVVSAHGDDAVLCRRAARLGLDAFDPDEVSDELARLLTDSVARLPDATRDDFLDAGVSAHLVAPTLGAVTETVLPLEGTGADPRVGQGDFSKGMGPSASTGAPHVDGYAMARGLRTRLGLPSNGRVDLDQTLRAMGWAPVIEREQGWSNQDRHVKGIAGRSRSGAPCLLAAPKPPRQERFLLARGLYVLLSGATLDSPRIVTSAGNRLQAASRAFAAELLAPAEVLRARVAGAPIDEERVDEIADELDVSPALVAHQIENHELA